VLKMNNIILKEKLKQNLMKLNKEQFKIFWGMLVHYWLPGRLFISNQNFLNLWCELNLLCYQSDESFPSPYDDHNLIKSFCEAHPYYFIDMLDLDIVKNLFCDYLNDRIDILSTIAKKLHTEGLRASYEYSNKALGLNENVEEIVAKAEKHIKEFS
jgi:uncharacterized protein YozE (UPF0346 family)